MDPATSYRLVQHLMMEAFLPIAFVLLATFAMTTAAQSRFPSKEAQLMMASWVFHVVAWAANAYMIKVLYGRGDPISFVKNGTHIVDVVMADPINLFGDLARLTLQMPYEIDVDTSGGKGSTHTMYGLSAISQILVGSNFFTVHLSFCMASFFGKLGMYTAFRSWISPHHRIPVLIATCFTPSVVFWSAGIIKESVVLTGLGIACLGALWTAQRRPSGLVMLAVGIYTVALLKSFILLVVVIAVAGYLYWYRSVQTGRIEIKPISLLAGLVLAAVGLAAVGYIFPKYSLANLGAEAAASQKIGTRTYGSFYQIGDPNDTSLFGQMRYAPLGLFTGWFRPGLWEARNPQMAVNGFETAVFLLLTIRGAVTAGYQGLVDRLVRYPPALFCLLFAGGMGAGTGLTSFNLGSLSRYRMPLIPFLMVFLVILNTPVSGKKKRRVKRKPRQNTSRSPI